YLQPPTPPVGGTIIVREKQPPAPAPDPPIARKYHSRLLNISIGFCLGYQTCSTCTSNSTTSYDSRGL
ncbi:unnamed protein product, partial [Rotaria socialis]